MVTRHGTNASTAAATSTRAVSTTPAAFKFCHDAARGKSEAMCLAAVAKAGYGGAAVKLLYNGFVAEHYVVTTEWVHIGLLVGLDGKADEVLTFCLNRLKALIEVERVRECAAVVLVWRLLRPSPHSAHQPPPLPSVCAGIALLACSRIFASRHQANEFGLDNIDATTGGAA